MLAAPAAPPSRPNRRPNAGLDASGALPASAVLSVSMTTPSIPVVGPASWRRSDMNNSSDWTVRLTAGMCAEIETAMQVAHSNNLSAPAFTATHFPLPTLAPKLAEIIDEVSSGRGFVLLRGLPVEQRGAQAVKDILWGLGCHWGSAITQNKAGDAIAEITDLGMDATKPGVKPSLTNAEQRPHSDPSDIVALLCVRSAPQGGVSRIASTIAIYNRLLEEMPEQMECLYRGFHHDLRGDATEDAPHGCTPIPIPVYRHFRGVLSCVFNASTVKAAERLRGIPVPAHEMAVLDRMVELAHSDEFRLDMEFQPGDIQLLNNYTTVHWRTGYVDHPEPERKRRLYRLWLNRPGTRPVDPAMHRGYITGSQAGMPVAGTGQHSIASSGAAA